MLRTSSYKDIDRWEAAKLIDGVTAQRLRAELDENGSRYNLSFVLSVLATILVGAAVVTFVAANWQDMPRIARVGLICLAIALGYGIGAWRLMRGDKILSESFFLIGAISYGAGIALVGQMYHLSGDGYDALLTWCIGVGSAAFLLRSSTLSSMAIFLACGFPFLSTTGIFLHSSLSYSLINSLLFIVGINLCIWTKSRVSRHFMILFLALILVDFMGWHDWGRASVLSLAVFYVVLFLFDWLLPSLIEKVTHFSGAFGNWALLLAFIFLWIRQLDIINPYQGVTFLHKFFCTSSILLLCVVALWSSHQRGWGTRLIALIMFFAEVYYLIWQTIDSLMMQSLFFLGAAIVFFLVARFSMKRSNKIQNGEVK